MFHVEQPKPHRWPVGIFSVPRGTRRISLQSVRSRGQRTPVLSELLFHNTGAVPYETIRIEHHRPQGIGHHRLFHVEPIQMDTPPPSPEAAIHPPLFRAEREIALS